VHGTTLLDRPDGEAPERDVRRHLGEIYGCSTTGWQVVARHRIDEALPATPPGTPVRRPVALGDGVFVCGDHRDTASIQGALVSGRRAAAAVQRALAG
jgi:predicted NAD/FAD-dependent oxidoreductase